MKSGIYGIYCLANRRWYIGQSMDISGRLMRHDSALRNGTHNNRHLKRAWNKHGPDAFVHAIIEFCEADRNLLCERETFWISEFDSYRNGFNLTPAGGSSLGVKYTAESRAKMLAAQSDPDVKARIQATRTATFARPDVRARHADSLKNSNSRAEVKAKISAALKARLASPEARAKRSEKTKAAMARQDVRERLAAAHARPDVKERRSAASKAMWARRKLLAKKYAAAVQLELFSETGS